MCGWADLEDGSGNARKLPIVHAFTCKGVGGLND